ncbi:hypothetical protein [Lysobacter sp. CA199]|uniref:hypothetical protein n=1 Tax=Lysobacter sp. CA199 TaxID=3455608 RepID=UPI003F8D2A34
MNNASDRLDKEELDRTLREKVVPASGLSQLTSHERPKELHLQANPDLARARLCERPCWKLNGDVLVIDPGRHRDNLPGVKRL